MKIERFKENMENERQNLTKNKRGEKREIQDVTVVCKISIYLCWA